ncbi:MAG TPA: mannose-6-phosphate isomerase, partial [Beijerinckiaceae bacterium]|nr:mannose-6-phosphate isomerase [Beijerinckiaceae bacterium]
MAEDREGPQVSPDAPRWKHDGVRVIKGDRLDDNTAQTPGM